MKVTKSQIRQIIQEEVERARYKTVRDILRNRWRGKMEQVVLSAHNLFKKLPEEVKPYFIQNFEMYVKLWKGEDNNVEDLDFDPSGGL